MFSLKSVAAGATALALLATSATAETVIRIQSVLGNSVNWPNTHFYFPSNCSLAT